jgi:23S rRNA (cytosine1962-C5)-methyltransferase
VHPPEPIVRLKPGHVQPVWTGHPWVFAQAIDDVRGGATPGDVVRVEDPRGGFLGRGFYSPKSAIAVRVVTREAELPIDAAFFRTRIHAALTRRLSLGLGDEATDGYRLVHSEGDGLPGLIVDRFRDVLVVQLLTIGMKLREAMVLEALSDVIEPKAIVDRTPEHSAKAEGFARGEGVVRGTFDGELRFRERGFDFRLPKELGQKTATTSISEASAPASSSSRAASASSTRTATSARSGSRRRAVVRGTSCASTTARSPSRSEPRSPEKTSSPT